MITSHDLVDRFGYITHAEAIALKVLANNLPINPIVVNIGAGSGTSGLALMESRPDINLWTVDIQDVDSPFGCLYAEEQIMREAGYFDSERYHQICGDSRSVGSKWDNGDIDMVFIDDGHSYTECLGDINVWIKRVCNLGVIAVHDYHKKENWMKYSGGIEPSNDVLDRIIKPWPGVDRAVDEALLGKYEIISHVDTLIAFLVTHSKPKTR